MTKSAHDLGGPRPARGETRPGDPVHVAYGDAAIAVGVNVADQGILANHYGPAIPPGAAATPVPEPVTLTLLILGGLTAIRCRRS